MTMNLCKKYFLKNKFIFLIVRFIEKNLNNEYLIKILNKIADYNEIKKFVFYF